MKETRQQRRAFLRAIMKKTGLPKKEAQELVKKLEKAEEVTIIDASALPYGCSSPLHFNP
jgi:hypothetical protein